MIVALRLYHSLAPKSQHIEGSSYKKRKRLFFNWKSRAIAGIMGQAIVRQRRPGAVSHRREAAAKCARRVPARR